MIAAPAHNAAGAAVSPAALGLFSGVTVLPHADTSPPADVQSWTRRLNLRVVAISEAGGVHIRGDEWIAVGPGRVTPVWSGGRTVLSPRSRIPL